MASERSDLIRRFGAATAGALVAALVIVPCLTRTVAVAATAHAVAPNPTEVGVLSTSTYGAVLVWTGKAAASASYSNAPLYEFSGDANGKFGCTTQKANGYDFPGGTFGLYSCTGPTSDVVNGVSTDDWPALTTVGTPVAGPGVNQKLLGTEHRPGVGDQVSYGGHPLYLFDPPSNPFDPGGEGYLESVYPAFPWHGIWYLVSARDGRPAPGPTTIGTEYLPDKQPALAYLQFGLSGTPITVYSYSLDRQGVSECTATCSLTWLPLLTMGEPQVQVNIVKNPIVQGGPVGHVATQDLGVIRRADGTEQVTYGGKPLYLYSREHYVFANGGPSSFGTTGNGNGLRGPNGGTFSVVYLGH